MPKGSIRDSGLTNFIQGITKREQLLNYPNVGAAFEAFIAEEIIKGIQATDNVNWKHYYFRTRNYLQHRIKKYRNYFCKLLRQKREARN